MSVPLTPELDPRLYRLLSIIAAAPTPEARVRAANREITAYLAERPIGSELVLANAIHDELTQRIRFRTGPDLAGHFGVSQRTIQRALKTTLGHGPKWISRRIRLQEIARLLSVQGPVDLSILAADLGYTDEAHLINDFRGVAGTTPGAYRRALQAFTDR